MHHGKGKHGKGKEGGHHRQKRCGGGMCGEHDPEMKRKWMSSLTMTDLVLWGIDEEVEHIGQ